MPTLVWQVYIDGKKTIADGRKLPQKLAVDYPQMQEIKEVLEHLGFDAGYEEKAYPRDLSQFGRFRVMLKDPVTGETKVEGITNSAHRLLNAPVSDEDGAPLTSPRSAPFREDTAAAHRRAHSKPQEP